MRFWSPSIVCQSKLSLSIRNENNGQDWWPISLNNSMTPFRRFSFLMHGTVTIGEKKASIIESQERFATSFQVSAIVRLSRQGEQANDHVRPDETPSACLSPGKPKYRRNLLCKWPPDAQYLEPTFPAFFSLLTSWF